MYCKLYLQKQIDKVWLEKKNLNVYFGCFYFIFPSLKEDKHWKQIAQIDQCGEKTMILSVVTCCIYNKHIN